MKVEIDRSIDRKRRTLMGSGAGMMAAASVPAALLQAPAQAAEKNAADPWQRARDIEQKFAKPLKFRDEDFVITTFGARPCKLAPVTATIRYTEKADVPSPVPGSPDAWPAISAAIAACNKAGGGRVVIPKGDWYVAGPIVLRSNVHVYLAAGAHVYFSANPADYAKYGDIDCGANGKLSISRWQGNDVLNYSPLVYAYGQTNIALTGEDWTSVLNGQGGVPFENGEGCWWDWKGRHNKGSVQTEIAVNERNPKSMRDVAPDLPAHEREMIEATRQSFRADVRYLPALSEAGVPVAGRIFGVGHYLRPSMIEFIGCTDVLMDGYMVTATPFWQHHPVNCRNVHIRKVRMESQGPNSDGFDPEACDTVFVEHCEFNAGDDCIAIKAGRNRDIEFGPTRNVLVQDCVMNSGHGGMTLGSEMAGGIEHVYAQRLEFRNKYWQTSGLNTAIRMKTNMNRGGFLRHFYVRDCTLPNGVATIGRTYSQLPGTKLPAVPHTTAGGVITIDCDYTPVDESVRIRPPEVSDVHISNLRVSDVQTPTGRHSCFQAFVILGPVAGTYNGPAGKPTLPLNNISITNCDFGTPRDAEQPWFAYNVKNLVLKDVKIAGKLVNQKIDA